MDDKKDLNETWGHAHKCGGIPKYPAEYHFKLDDPIEMSDEHVKARKERLRKFLADYGLELVEDI